MSPSFTVTGKKKQILFSKIRRSFFSSKLSWVFSGLLVTLLQSLERSLLFSRYWTCLLYFLKEICCASFLFPLKESWSLLNFLREVTCLSQENSEENSLRKMCLEKREVLSSRLFCLVFSVFFSLWWLTDPDFFFFRESWGSRRGKRFAFSSSGKLRWGSPAGKVMLCLPQRTFPTQVPYLDIERSNPLSIVLGRCLDIDCLEHRLKLLLVLYLRREEINIAKDLTATGRLESRLQTKHALWPNLCEFTWHGVHRLNSPVSVSYSSSLRSRSGWSFFLFSHRFFPSSLVNPRLTWKHTYKSTTDWEREYCTDRTLCFRVFHAPLVGFFPFLHDIVTCLLLLMPKMPFPVLFTESTGRLTTHKSLSLFELKNDAWHVKKKRREEAEPQKKEKENAKKSELSLSFCICISFPLSFVMLYDQHHYYSFFLSYNILFSEDVLSQIETTKRAQQSLRKRKQLLNHCLIVR